MSNQQAIIIGALIGGAFGFAGAVITALINRHATKQKRADDLFATALDFMGGGTQRRNLGIAAIALYWRQFPQYKQLCVEMLVGTAIYLICESEQKDKPHELFNLHRIMNLLEKLQTRGGDNSVREGYNRLKDVVNDRLSNYRAEPRKGLWVSKSDLEKWQEWL
ncbi:MAG: hypothetical protein QNJ53_14915 [Pleurocapsa sp. MO_192.B19]|nr:hypothetical protein [Pleurocapsa sp. MO_192.B19]